ncbi:MAG: DUF167 domain-containing protein [Promethearchaeota archaeon]|nr:MAG: DUF167 domain-containing protein [Candidatus Lokiarchaeota archaeon]
MRFIEQRSETSFLLHLNIKPNSKKVDIVENDQHLIVSLISKPVKNKANKELINILRKKLHISSTQIKILAGLKSTTKIIQIDFLEKTNEKEIIKRLTK